MMVQDEVQVEVVVACQGTLQIGDLPTLPSHHLVIVLPEAAVA